MNSFGTQNLAVTVLFSRLTSFNNSGCENHAELKYLPLSESGMIWTYPGHGAQTLGNLDPYELKLVKILLCPSAFITKFLVAYLFKGEFRFVNFFFQN